MPRLLAEHLALSALAAAALAAWFGLALASVIGHVIVVSLGQASVLASFMASRVWWPRVGRLLLVALPYTLLTAQAILYLLQAFSYSYWGRSMTVQIVLAYLPGVLDGTEPLPVGPTLLLVAIAAVGITQFALIPAWAPVLAEFVERHATNVSRSARRALAVGTLAIWALSAAVVVRGAISDSPVWYSSPIVSFVRGNPVVFEPTERRRAVGDADDALREAYPRDTAAEGAPHVVLIVVDSLRADHMSAYGYPRATTPFLDSLVAAGAHRVERVMATCPESYCGITSLLTSRPFRDITVKNFKLQEALSLSGYMPVFLLSGLHTGWYNMGQFYGGRPHHLMDGRDDNGFGLSDDRQVLTWLDHLPSPPPMPAFIYIHLMSVHEVGHLQPEYAALAPPASEGLAAAPVQRLSRQRYEARVRQADAVIEEIFARLTRLGYLDHAVTVVTSDHGEALGRRHFGHGDPAVLARLRDRLRAYLAGSDAPLTPFGTAASADVGTWPDR